MPFQDIPHFIIRGNQILINMGNPDLVLVFQEGSAHAFLKKTAEIFGVKHGNLGDFFQGNWSVVIVVNVI